MHPAAEEPLYSYTFFSYRSLTNLTLAREKQIRKAEKLGLQCCDTDKIEKGYLPELFRQIRMNLPEQFRQIRLNLPELFRQIRINLPKLLRKMSSNSKFII